MTTPHERAVENAGRTTIRLGDLFDRIGHTESRRGIFRAYRNAVASIALASAGGGVDLAAFDDIAAQLRQTVELVTDGLLQNAIEMGIYAGINDAEIYGLVIDSVMNRDIGAPAIFGNRFEGYDFAQFGIGAKVHEVLNEWGRQAVAVIDERTTDCCLRVHGQWQAFGDDFRLTGTPRYADHMGAPPFHKWCRTATALVQRKYAADDLTRQMRDAARDELVARKTAKPRRKVITPANAFSRRA